jgi:hypothetical protein
MNPRLLVDALRSGAVADVDNRDVLALLNVLTGYNSANNSLGELLSALEDRIPGPFSANGFIKAYLASSADAPSLVFEQLSLLLEGPFSALAAVATPHTEAGFPALALWAIRQDRPAMLLFEPTQHCLAMNWIGFVLGATAVDAEVGERQRLEAAAFDAWVRRRYETPNVHWSRALRIFGGCGLDGLRAFDVLWTEFLEERAAAK